MMNKFLKFLLKYTVLPLWIGLYFLYLIIVYISYLIKYSFTFFLNFAFFIWFIIFPFIVKLFYICIQGFFLLSSWMLNKNFYFSYILYSLCNFINNFKINAMIKKNIFLIGVWIKNYLIFYFFLIVKYWLFFIIQFHVYLHKHFNLYRTFIFIYQYNYIYLIFNYLFSKIFKNKWFCIWTLNKPLQFSIFWYCLTLCFSFLILFFFTSWFIFIYLIFFILNLLYIFYLFCLILGKYLLFNWKNKLNLCYLVFMSEILVTLTVISHKIEKWGNLKNLYVLKNFSYNKKTQQSLQYMIYKISFLFLLLNINNIVKLAKLQKHQNKYLTNYKETVYSSLFFKQNIKPASLDFNVTAARINTQFLNHQQAWQDLGILGNTISESHNSWKMLFINQLTTDSHFLFFTKVINYFSSNLNKTWDKIKINNITNNIEDFSYYNNANLRLDHLYGDMSIASDEIGYLKHKQVLKQQKTQQKKFLQLFSKTFNLNITTLFNFSDHNIINLHKQNKISHLIWKTIYFWLRKHREFQWSTKQLKTVYKIEPLQIPQQASIWNYYNHSNNLQTQQISWPLFFSKVMPSLFYTFSFIHDFFFSFCVEFLSDFYSTQVNLVKTSYFIKKNIKLIILNNTLYNFLIILFVKIIWFILYDFWRILFFFCYKFLLNIKYLTTYSNLFQTILDQTLHWLLYLLQFIKINNYTLITHFYLYQWNNFFQFKIQSYKNTTKRVKYYNYGFFLIIVDLCLFSMIFFILLGFDLCKFFLYLCFYNLFSSKLQKLLIRINILGRFFYYNTLYRYIYWVLGFKIYYDLYYNLTFTNKYIFESVQQKKFHMKRYQLFIDLQGNWLEKNNFSKNILKLFFLVKILKKYWWSIEITNQKGLKRWPFFYNWCKKIVEIDMLYNFFNILLFLIYYWLKKISYFIYDYGISNCIFLYQLGLYLSIYLLFTYCFYFFRIYFLEWMIYFFTLHFTSWNVRQHQKISFSKNFYSTNFIYNIQYKNNFLYQTYLAYEQKNLSTNSSVQIVKYTTAVNAFESIYNAYDQKNIMKTKSTCSTKEFHYIKTQVYITSVQAFFSYLELNKKNLPLHFNKNFINSSHSEKRLKYITAQTKAFNCYKQKVYFFTLEHIWFTFFCEITNTLISWINKRKLYMNKINMPVKLLNNYTYVNNIYFSSSFSVSSNVFNYLNSKILTSFFLKKKPTPFVSKQKKKSSTGLKKVPFNSYILNWNFNNKINLKYSTNTMIIYTFIKWNTNWILQIWFFFFFKLFYIFYIEKNFIYLFYFYSKNKKDKISNFFNIQKLKRKNIQKKKNKINIPMLLKLWKQFGFKVCYYFCILIFFTALKKTHFLNQPPKRLKKLLYIYKLFYKNLLLTDVNYFLYDYGIKNKVYWKYIIFKDMIHPSSKTQIISNFLNCNDHSEININLLIKDELVTLEEKGIFNYEIMNQELHFLNLNYFLYLRNNLKSIFFSNFSTSRVQLNFRILRLLLRTWRLRQQTRKFTSYFLKLFLTSAHAFNLTRRNAFAKWHVFEGTNYSGESKQSAHKLNIKKNKFKKGKWNFNCGFFGQKNLKKRVLYIYIKEKMKNFIYDKNPLLSSKKNNSKNFIFKTIPDLFISNSNIFGKRFFIGIFFDDFSKKYSKWVKWKISFFFWWNMSWGPYLIVPAIFILLFVLFGFTFLNNIEMLCTIFLWCFQIIFALFEQWFGLFLILPFTIFSNLFFIEWFVIISAFLDPFIFNNFFFNPDLMFLSLKPVRLSIDILLLTMNNSYIINDYSLHKVMYQLLLMSIYIFFYFIWKLYILFIMITMYIFTIPFGVSCSFSTLFHNFFFIWDFLLILGQNFFLYSFYSFYILYKMNFITLLYIYMIFMKQICVTLFSYIYILFFIDLSINLYLLNEYNFFYHICFYGINILKNLLENIHEFYDFFFFLVFYYSAYIKVYIIYIYLMLKYIYLKFNIFNYEFLYLYIQFIFQDFNSYEFLDSLLQLWVWIYFNCIYYIIIYPLKWLIYSLWVICQQVFWLIGFLPQMSFMIIYKLGSIISMFFFFIWQQFLLVINFLTFIIIKPLLYLYKFISSYIWAFLTQTLWFTYIKYFFINFMQIIYKVLFFPYYIIYKLFFYFYFDLMWFFISFQVIYIISCLYELLLFYMLFFWNIFSGLWGLGFIISDLVNLFFPNIDKILYPLGGFSFFYAVCYYYIFILFAILWSRSFRIFNDTSNEIPVPDYVWENVKIKTEGSKIYNIMPLHLYKLLWIEKLSTNKPGLVPQELLTSLDTWTIRDKHTSYHLLIRLHETPLNMQGFYYKYLTDLTRPFVINYYKQRLQIKMHISDYIPLNDYKVLLRRLKYALWIWYVEVYLAYVYDDESYEAISVIGPSPNEIAAREANFDGQFDVLLTNKAVLRKIKHLKLYNFYFMKKTNKNVGMAQDVWLTFPIIGHIFGRDHLHKIKSMKNRETFIFEFTPGINKNQNLTAKELALNNYYIHNWMHLNTTSIWKFSTNIQTRGNAQLYSIPQGKPLDLKADPKFYRLYKYIKVDEDDEINPDFLEDYMYLGSRSLDIFLTPFLTFAAINTAWWNTENGIATTSVRLLELSNVADVLIKNYIHEEFEAEKPYNLLRQQFLSAFSSGEFRYEFLDLEEDDINLITYGKPLVDKNLKLSQTELATHILKIFPEIQTQTDNTENFITNFTGLMANNYTKSIIDDTLITLINNSLIAPLFYERWSSPLENLLFKDYYIPHEDLSNIHDSQKQKLFENIFTLTSNKPNLNEFTYQLRNLIVDELLFFSKKTQWESAFTNKVVGDSLGYTVKSHTFGETFNFKTPKLFDKEIEIGTEIPEKEQWRRVKGASKEKLLEATTANYNIYTTSLNSNSFLEGTLLNYYDSIYHYKTLPEFSPKELNNVVFINFFSDNKAKIILQKQDLKNLVDFNLIDASKYLQSDFSISINNNIRSTPIESFITPTRFEIEERDKVLTYLTNNIHETITTIDHHYFNHENPSLVNLYDECRQEMLLGKLFYRSTASAPAFGYFVKFYILQRLFSLYITAYENTIFGNLFYYITRAILVRFPVTGLDVLPLIILDLNNNADIYYTSGFYGLPRINTLQKEFLIPYTQYTYTQHYLMHSLKQTALLYFTDKNKFLKELPQESLNINWNMLPYLHPELDIDKKARMIYQHIYSASFEYPNIYNEGIYLIKLREFIYFLGIDVWLSEVKDVFTIETHILYKGWKIFNNLISWDFWIFFFRADWIIFVEDHSNWFNFTFHIFGYLEHKIDLYPAIWYSMHFIEYTKTFFWFIFDITKFLYFPNWTLYYLRFNFWYNIISPFFFNFSLSLNNALMWWYNNIWFYRWFIDVSSYFMTIFLNKNPLLYSFLYEQGSGFTWTINLSHCIHFLVYWKNLETLIPYATMPTILLILANVWQINIYNFFAEWIIDNHFIILSPITKQQVFSFFTTNLNSFLYYNLWYDYYLIVNNITESKQKMFLSVILNNFLNIRYDAKLYPTILKENIISPYSFKINYGTYFLTPYEVNLLFNTDFYKKDAIAAYHAFDFLLTKPSNSIYYKNLIELGDSKKSESGFLFNFQALYQDLITADFSTNILNTVNVETFQALKIYEDELQINNLRLFFYKYFYLMVNHEIVDLAEQTELNNLIKQDCEKNNIFLSDMNGTWKLMYDKEHFKIPKTGYENEQENTYFLINKTIDGNFYMFKCIYKN